MFKNLCSIGQTKENKKLKHRETERDGKGSLEIQRLFSQMQWVHPDIDLKNNYEKY